MLIKKLLKRKKNNSIYWSNHNVTNHKQFSGIEESIQYLQWRNDQYYNYEQLMPTYGFDNKRVLDYGCGPGHDIVGFGINSKPLELFGVDVSAVSLQEAQKRIDMHGISANLLLLDENKNELPFDNDYFDYIHSSGVLHHVGEPVTVLKELKRVLKSDGTVKMMLYNYDSIWLHLYVAYQRNIVQGLYPDESFRDQFRHSTDGEDCPISNIYKYQDWISLCDEAGLKCEFIGAAISMHEMNILPSRFEAIQNIMLRNESRIFLTKLKFDEYGYPLYQGNYAGIDACYEASVADINNALDD